MTPPTAFPIESVLTSMRSAFLASNRLSAVLGAQLGVNSTELSALGHVAQEPGLTPKHLSELLGITTGSTTGTADRLAKAGFLLREPHPQDRRSVLLKLTPAGVHAVQWVFEQYGAALTAAIARRADLSPEDIAGFFQALAESLEAAASEPVEASQS